MNSDVNPSCKWVGLIEVAQNEGKPVLGVGRGAHVTAIAWCRSANEFRTTIQASLEVIDLRLVATEEVETCAKRMLEYSISDEFVNLMNEVGPDNPAAFLDFYTFPLED